jgi:hypothetical protein
MGMLKMKRMKPASRQNMLDPIFCGFFEKYQFYIGANNEHFGPGN